MDLAHAFHLSNRSRIAFVGAGGKTSAMFRMARQVRGGRALVSATTHLSIEQIKLADTNLVVDDLHKPGSLHYDNLSGVTVYTGKQIADGRVEGLSSQAIAELASLADDLNLPLLIEADGSRQLPLKAPDYHEPLIPDFINQVVYVVGLSSVGVPLTTEFVHRPERFADLCGCKIGEEITPEMISCLLLHSDGGLKGIPSGASRWALLNQAKTDEHKSIGFRIADNLLGEYWGVAIANIPFYSQWDIPSGSQHDPERDVISVRVPVAGVILAAGSAQRMGLPKQILPWRGEPLIVHVARAALGAGLDPAIIVTGANEQAVTAAVADLPVEVVHNASWEVGQSTSIKTGLDALPINTGAVVFLQADQPLVTPALIDALLEAHASSFHPVVAPLVDGERSSPVLFDRSTFSDLAHIEGDVGGRELFALYNPRWIDWYDHSVRFDVDTEADYRRLLEEYP